MRVLSFSCALVCFAIITPTFNCFETPSLELNIVIATTTSVNETYFDNEIKEFLTKLTQAVIFPEEVNDNNPEFARVAINVGGNSGTDGQWTFRPLQNLSRHQINDQIDKLTMPVGNYTRKGCIDSLNQAYEIYTWINSITAVLDRFTIILTDEILESDTKSDVAKLLNVMSEKLFIIGIPSEANPTFNNSIEAALNLTSTAYLSINEASEDVFTYIITSIGQPKAACRGIIFAYEASNYVDIITQQNFTLFARLMQPSFTGRDAVAMVSFDDLIKYNFAFLSPQKYAYWKTPYSSDFNPDVYYKLPSVYHVLGAIAQETVLPYIAIVVLTQADHYVDTDEVTLAMGALGARKNVDVFVYNTGDASPQDFYFLTGGHPERIFNAKTADYDMMSEFYGDNIYPMIKNHTTCGVVASQSTVSPVSPTTENPKISTTPSAGNSYFTSVTVAMGIAVMSYLI